MMKLVFIGLWACIISLASSFAVGYFKPSPGDGLEKPSAIGDLQKTKEINVPKILGGVIKGYVVAQFSYAVDPTAFKKLQVSPDVYIVDEAFRYIYNDESIDFGNMQKIDLKNLTDSVIKQVNTRLKAPIVASLMIQELTFLTASDVRQPL